jgi:hypothetical protein
VLAAALTPITGLVADPVAAENPVTSCDLYVLVKEAAEPVSSERPYDDCGTWSNTALGRALMQ